MKYLFERKKDGKKALISDAFLMDAMLEVAGGGMSARQTANAMIWTSQLRAGQTVKTSTFTVKPQ